jgi:ankyrin repeat protein
MKATTKYSLMSSALLLLIGGAICCTFLSLGPQNENANNELFEAVARAHIVGAKQALARGAHVDSRRKFEDSPAVAQRPLYYICNPLHLAASRGNKDLVQLLIAAGAEVDAKDSRGRNALFWAAAGDCRIRGKSYPWRVVPVGKLSLPNTGGLRQSRDFTAGARLLIAHGAKVNSADRDGATPLHAAAISGQKDLAAVLIVNRAKINARTNMECTPLHWAASAGHKDIVDLLIANGAEVNAVTILPKYQRREFHGHTALYYAIKEGHDEVAKRLRKYGAKLSGKEQASIDDLLVVHVYDDRIDRVKEAMEKGANPKWNSRKRGFPTLRSGGNWKP